MILLYFILILLIGGAIAWITGKLNDLVPRIVSLVALSVNLILAISLYLNRADTGNSDWLMDYNVNWIPHFGISFHLALDGLSLLLILLTFFLGILSVLVSWKEIKVNVGFFHFNILWILCGITGVFLSLDLFLFYFFWELMLVPMYFLISIWGHENRVYASYKFDACTKTY